MTYYIWDNKEVERITKEIREKGASEKEVMLALAIVSEANAYHNDKMLQKDITIAKLQK